MTAPSSVRPANNGPRGWPLRVLGTIATPYRRSTGTARGMLVAGTILTGIVVLVALLAPLLAPYDFDQVRNEAGERFPKQGAPSGEHLLGTNVRSNDLLSRVIWGAQTELKVVLLALALTLAAGVLLGLVSGFVGGWLDRVLVLIMDALFAFPYLLLAIVIAFLLGGGRGGVVTAAVSITVVYIPQYFRVVRNSTVSAKQATYVEAARALGASPMTVMIRYLFTNVIQSVPVIATLNAADAILTLAGLGFLGYGIEASQGAEWGYELNRAIDDVQAGIWWTGLYPGLAIVILVMGLTLMGEGLNETLNPTLRVRRLVPVVLPPREKGPSASEPTMVDERPATEETAAGETAAPGEPASDDKATTTERRGGDERAR